MNLCPCGSQIEYSQCCEIFLKEEAFPATPLELMRSRYTAFTRADTNYIGKTQKKLAAKNYDPDNTKRWAAACEWLGLTIMDAPPPNDTHGIVEFLACFRENGIDKTISEKSFFEKIDNRWYYVKGIHKTTHDPVPGRNDPCTCGSGRKYKKCCGIS